MVPIVLSAFIAGFCAGWLTHIQHFKHIMFSNPAELEEMLRKVKYVRELNDRNERKYATSILAAYEQHGKMWYVFAVDDDEFLGQGLTEEEALENAREKFPGVEIIEQ